MNIEVTKQMIDATFDFIEGRRTKKENKSVVLRGVRGKEFPDNLLRKPSDKTPLSYYMDGEKQAIISKKFDLPMNMPAVYGRIGRRYARQIELYWTYTAVMEFITPVREKNLQEVIATKMKFETLIKRCYENDITTVGKFLDEFVKNEVVVVKRRLIKAEYGIFDVIFQEIRNACYALLQDKGI